MGRLGACLNKEASKESKNGTYSLGGLEWSALGLVDTVTVLLLALVVVCVVL